MARPDSAGPRTERARSWVMRRLGLEPGEGGSFLLMGSLVATLFCAYTIAKVLRDALFLAEFSALVLPWAYIGVALASVGFVWLEARMARRLTRAGAMWFHQVSAVAVSLLAAFMFQRFRHWTSAWFYLWTGSQAMMLLPHFWALALDVWDSRRARRVFPLLGGCGLLGGLAGGAYASWAARLMGRTGLLWTLAALFAIAHGLSRLARARGTVQASSGAEARVSRWEIIRGSRYLQVFAAALALSVVVSTLVDFQFKVYVQRTYPDPHALTQFLGHFYVGLNGLSLLVQLGTAGWLIQRLGLVASTSLQPAAVMTFATLSALGSGWWAVLAMRWLQGVVFQTLGKSSTEIYYAAVPPRERRRVKPAIDTLVERWSDAAVGVLLVVALQVLGVRIPAIAIMTAALAGLWLAVLIALDRQYGHAFQRALSGRWIESELETESLRLPASRRALAEALEAGDPSRIVLALKLSARVRDATLSGAVRRCLGHASPEVAAAALEAMEELRLPERESVVEALLDTPHEGLKGAAVNWLLARGAHPAAFARRALESEDPVLVQCALQALLDRPWRAPGLLTFEWIDERLGSEAPAQRALGAKALGAMAGGGVASRLGELLEDSDLEVRRAALLSATRRPGVALLGALLPLLMVPELSHEARRALAAIGDPALPALRRLLDGGEGARAQALAARTIADIATPRALQLLRDMLRTTDPARRRLALRGLVALRVRSGRPVVPRGLAHRLFLRDLREFRELLEPARALEGHASPEVRLLGESYRESAEMAFERALQSLACWYDPRPLSGVFERLARSDREPADDRARGAANTAAASALEFLGHLLPRQVFQPLSALFEAGGKDEAPAPRLATVIRVASQSDDPWLRACALRAAPHAGLDPRRFHIRADDPLVRAELRAVLEAPAC